MKSIYHLQLITDTAVRASLLTHWIESDFAIKKKKNPHRSPSSKTIFRRLKRGSNSNHVLEAGS